MNIFGKIILGRKLVEAGIIIEDGIITKIGKQISGKKMKGIIMPAGIDVHVHLRDFEESHKETIKTGTLAALNGGICLVVDQPNTKPFIDSEERYIERIKKAEKWTNVDYSLNIGLTRKNYKEIQEIVGDLRNMGYNPKIGEVFLCHEKEDYQIDYEIIENLKTFLTIHAEDPAYIISNEIPNFKFRKREAEIEAVRILSEGEYYFCHISTKDAAKMIFKGPSYIEVTPHHLLLDEGDYERLGKLVNVNPPLRKREDREFLLSNFHEIDVLASDHAPHTIEEKENGASGYPNVETMYPIMMGLVFKGVLNIFDLSEKIAENPAKIFGFKGYGEIREGNYANFAIFDISQTEKIKTEKLHSKCEWTPYVGFEAIFPHTVVIRGEIVKEDGEIFEGFGRVYTDKAYIYHHKNTL
uniref:Dihydroorotase n=1 Tax=Geoglobus ahangari TaxID=113653 RepID=A0A7C3UBH5_9EURY